MRRLAVEVRWPGSAVVADPDAFDLDDLGTLVGEHHAAVRASHGHGEFDDLEAGQRASHVSARPFCWFAALPVTGGGRFPLNWPPWNTTRPEGAIRRGLPGSSSNHIGNVPDATA